MNIVIISAGDIQDYIFCKKYFIDCKYIICADGGAKHLEHFKKEPSVFIGDFDSIDKSLFDEYKNRGIEFISYNTDKDKTDTHIALDYAIKQNGKNVVILGGYGSRMDHSLSNIYLLEYAKKKDINLVIADGKNETILAINETEIINDMPNSFLSLIPISKKVCGITTKGLKFELSNTDLKRSDSLGVSNQILNEKAKVSFGKGKLLIIKSRD